MRLLAQTADGRKIADQLWIHESNYGRNMVKFVAISIAAAWGAGCGAFQASAAEQDAPPRVVGYYYGPTAQRGFPPSSLDGRLLTHIIYAFGRLNPDGSVALADPQLDNANFAALGALKRQHPHLRILIAFGGWGGSKHFSDAAATPESRARFIRSTIDVFLRAHRDVFDGVDLDWEYPVGGGMAGNTNRPEDRENLTALVVQLRRALDAETRRTRRKYLITMATPAGETHLQKYELRRLGELLDFMNVMTYDFHTGGRTTHYNAPLAASSGDPTPQLNVQASVAAYRAAGVPARKLVIGVPFYGYGYGGVPPENRGRFQPAERNGLEDSAAGARHKYVGSVRFREIAGALAEGFQRHWDAEARVPWLYNPTTRTWITYDDAQSIAEKAEYVRKADLGGIMIWELSGDDGTLLPVINQRLGRRVR